MTPIRFKPDMERPAPDEAVTIHDLDTEMRSIQQTTLHHGGHALRGVHAKTHGMLEATLVIPASLPADLAQGLFATPGAYQAMLRFSTLPGDILDDSVSTPRGVALKIIGAAGPRLRGQPTGTDQDFIMVNSPAFAAPTPKKFLGTLKTLARTTNHAPGAKIALSHVARAAETVIEAFGGKSATVVTMGGQRATHILGESFYSQTPFLFGDYIAKFALVPASPNLTALTGASLDIDAQPDALREAVRTHFASQGAEWDLKVQLCTNLETMPIEDASVIWPDDESPYVTVAQLRCPAQDSYSAEKRRLIDQGMSFSPWHGLAAHRPLGGVNRARDATYQGSAQFRLDHAQA